MFIVYLFRTLIVIAIVFLVYIAYKYVVNPKRKLNVAKEKKQFYFLDEEENVQKNFLMTYKGILFEGEKYIGTIENAFDVVSISVYAKEPEALKGLERDDLFFLEKEILIHYPFATVEWKYPINELLNHSPS
ncbi:sigma-w pathway protein ysdB [Paraliobacillus ryukyuensis]|uniref:sigma-w pathway protein ysdB n=1 Tax=Paraliobacillus ryukyuensis TaxID=200904 RepID=UPI0009A83260|nr:sigma-w pathway protein ysdB [Paraliobacillus ryukyuensis]